VKETCPACGAHRYQKHGHTRHGKQHHPCTACGRQCTAEARDRSLPSEPRRRLDHLLRERLALRGICRPVGVSLTWLWHGMVECCTACPEDLHVQRPGRPPEVLLSRLEAAADALWRCVQKQANQHWSWMAMAATTRQVIAFHVGERSRESGKELWGNMPLA
jgi:insertion element IS1 protein InsB